MKVSISKDYITESFKCISLAMKLDDEFRKAMIASAASVLVERGKDLGTSRLIAEQMIDRIFNDDIQAVDDN